MGVVRIRSGGLAVANGGTTQVLVFDRTGNEVKALGRQGAGPGEFRRLWAMFRAGPGFAAIDNTGRANVYSDAAALTRTINRPVVSGSGRPEYVGFLSDGRPVVRALQALPGSPADAMRSYAIAVSDGGDGYRTLFSVQAFHARDRNQSDGSPLLFRPTGVVAANGRRICAGFTERFLVRCYDASGCMVMQLQRDRPVRAISDDEREAARRAYIAANTAADPASAERSREEAARLEFARDAPAFGQLLLSEDGEVWVSDFFPGVANLGPRDLVAPAAPLRWSIWGADGRWLSDLLLPAHFVPYDVGKDYVAGVSFDPDGVERVTVWRVSR